MPVSYSIEFLGLGRVGGSSDLPPMANRTVPTLILGGGGSRERRVVIPGSSIRGLVRQVALGIATEINGERRGREIVYSLFGDPPTEEREKRESPVRFSSLLPDPSTGVRVVRRTRVAIDRRTGAAKRARLLREEVISPGSRFVGKVWFRSTVGPEEREFVIAALKALEHYWAWGSPVKVEVMA